MQARKDKVNTYDVAKWERTKEIAQACGVTWKVRDTIELYDAKGFSLGHQSTVDEAFAFLCGYEYSRTANDRVSGPQPAQETP